MTLRAFLFACEATMKEEGLSFHVETAARPEPSPADVKQQNAQSMQMLQGMLAGVSKKKGSRR